MKKHITGILISLLVLSTMSGCGKDKKITYMDEQATTSDATNASEIHLNYDIADERMSFTIDADVDTTLSNRAHRLQKLPGVIIPMTISNALQMPSLTQAVTLYLSHTHFVQWKM